MALVSERYETAGEFSHRIGERRRRDDYQKREQMRRARRDGNFENGEGAFRRRENRGEFVRADAEEMRGGFRGHREKVRGRYVEEEEGAVESL